MENLEFLSTLFDWAVKTIISLGIGAVVYLFKDSRDSLKAMQLSVQELNTNVATLIANDKSKAVTLAEHTQDIKELREDVVELKVKVKSGAKN